MHYGTFHQGTPRVSDAGRRRCSASDSDIYISANDVSATHFHIYAYKYTARTGTGGRLGHVNWTGTPAPRRRYKERRLTGGEGGREKD